MLQQSYAQEELYMKIAKLRRYDKVKLDWFAFA
jgi:hypothetical protein